MASADYVIVGGGINGLVAAACSARRAARCSARAQRPRRRLPAHRGDHRARLRARRDGDDAGAVPDIARLWRDRQGPGGARLRGRSFAICRPASFGPTARMFCSRATAPQRRDLRGLCARATARPSRREMDRMGADAPFLFSLLGGRLWSRSDGDDDRARGLEARAARARRLVRRGAAAVARIISNRPMPRMRCMRSGRPGACTAASIPRAPIPRR